MPEPSAITNPKSIAALETAERAAKLILRGLEHGIYEATRAMTELDAELPSELDVKRGYLDLDAEIPGVFAGILLSEFLADFHAFYERLGWRLDSADPETDRKEEHARAEALLEALGFSLAWLPQRNLFEFTVSPVQLVPRSDNPEESL